MTHRERKIGVLLSVALGFMCTTSMTFAQDGRPSRGGPPPFVRFQMAFTIFDANDDGALSEGEVPTFLWSRFSVADANEDGSVTREELKMMAANRLFDNFDENEDGSLSEDEVPAAVWRRLSRADADDNGAVTVEEFVSAQGGPPSRR